MRFVPEKRGDKGAKSRRKGVTAENAHILGKKLQLHVQEAERTACHPSTGTPSPSHVTLKWSKVSDKKIMSKAVQGGKMSPSKIPILGW